MKMERRFFPGAAALVKRADGKEVIAGHAAVYYDGTPKTEFKLWENFVERVMPGAFDRALAEKDDVRALFNHDPSALLGRASAGTLALKSDAKGLAYEIEPADTQVAKDVREHLRRGDLTGSSFAFVVTDQEFRTVNGVDIREIRGVQLFDVGPVTYPAYEGTDAGVRSGDADDARKALDAHRTAAAGRRRAMAARARAVEIEQESACAKATSAI
jgi:uncharacterized protein